MRYNGQRDRSPRELLQYCYQLGEPEEERGGGREGGERRKREGERGGGERREREEGERRRERGGGREGEVRSVKVMAVSCLVLQTYRYTCEYMPYVC